MISPKFPHRGETRKGAFVNAPVKNVMGPKNIARDTVDEVNKIVKDLTEDIKVSKGRINK